MYRGGEDCAGSHSLLIDIASRRVCSGKLPYLVLVRVPHHPRSGLKVVGCNNFAQKRRRLFDRLGLQRLSVAKKIYLGANETNMVAVETNGCSPNVAFTAMIGWGTLSGEMCDVPVYTILKIECK